MTICVAYGSTPEGAAALELAVGEARRRGEELVAVITERRGRQEAEGDVADRDRLHAEVDAALAGLRGPGDPAARVEVVDDAGDAAAAILDVVAAQGAELLVVGIKRRSPVGKLILGSVAQQIVLESSVPVLVTHAAR